MPEAVDCEIGPRQGYLRAVCDLGARHVAPAVGEPGGCALQDVLVGERVEWREREIGILVPLPEHRFERHLSLVRLRHFERQIGRHHQLRPDQARPDDQIAVLLEIDVDELLDHRQVDCRLARLAPARHPNPPDQLESRAAGADLHHAVELEEPLIDADRPATG